MVRGSMRLIAGLAWLACASVSAIAAEESPLRVYIGTSTSGKNEGIFVAELDPKTGALTEPRLSAETANPSFLAVHPTRKFVYAVGVSTSPEGVRSGVVVAFSVDPKTGGLTKLNEQSSGGAGPCHVVVDKAGRNVLVANYGGGSVASLPIDDDGKLKPAASVIQHEGKSVNPQRQSAPHAHSINLDAANGFAFAADLGLDQVLVYRFQPKEGTLTAHGTAKVAPGAGPRHFAFHPNGKLAYVINEIGNTITGFRYAAEKGELTEIQTISTLPGDFSKTSYTAEVVVHPSGKFVYGSNRGHDSIAIFSVEPETGRLTAVGHEPTQGKTPRNFNIDPSGRWLLAENQDSDSIFVFEIDPRTGRLKATGHKVSVKKPVCVKFVPIEGR